MRITDKIGLPNQLKFSREVLEDVSISVELDLGSGNNPRRVFCKEKGIKQILVDLNYNGDSFDSEEDIKILKCDFMDLDSLKSNLNEFSKIDGVVSIGSIEHVSKFNGLKMISNMLELASSYIIIETPNGFVHQSAVGGNKHQIHLSGWSVRDFREHGFTVWGTTGLKFLKNDFDKGSYKFNFRGVKFLDVVLSKLISPKLFPRMYFNIFAFKLLET